MITNRDLLRYDIIDRESNDEQRALDQVNTSSFPRLREWTPWDEVKKSDFARTWDYEVMEQGGPDDPYDPRARVILCPVSTAAKWWLHTFCNWADRWGFDGYIIQRGPRDCWFKKVTSAMRKAGLVSEDEYERSQENEQVIHQETRT